MFRRISIALGLGLTLAAAAPVCAQDTLLAGFTFSQFIGDGIPTVNAETFESTNFIVATYRGDTIPSSNVVDGTIIGQNSGTGFNTPSIASWSFSNFDVEDGVSVTAVGFNALNTANSTTVNGPQMHLTDGAGMGLRFNTLNTLWSIEVKNTSGYVNADTDDFTFAAVGNGGTATVEWLFNGTVFATSTITTGGFNTYAYELPGGFYGNGRITGRLTSGSVTFDNVQFNGAIGTPPVFSLQPVSRTVTSGSNVSFTARVTNVTAPTYRWSRNRVPLNNGNGVTGATTATLSLADVTLDDSASYTVVVSNNGTTAESTAAELTVYVPPVITTPPASQTIVAGTTATFSVNASGTPAPSYRWRKDGINLSNGGGITGATSSTLQIANTTSDSEGSYSVLVSVFSSSLESAPATLAVLVPPAITTGPSSQTIVAGATVTLSTTATGTPTPSFQWKKDGINLIDGVAGISGSTTANLQISGATAASAGVYTVLVSNSVGTVLSAPAALSIQVPPAITTPPVSQTVVAGNRVTFSVNASGSPAPSYQWRKGGSPIPTATGQTYTIDPVSLADAADYTVVVTNVAGSVTSSIAKLTVTSRPAFTAQPLASQTVTAGQPASFSVTVTGTPAPTFQWRKDGVILSNGGGISGATSATLRIDATTGDSAGVYTVLISNAAGTVESAEARLVVQTAPTVARQPFDFIAKPGETATFTVIAEGIPAPTYQWRKDGIDLVDTVGTGISGATTPTLTLDQLILTDAGDYTVVITNALGSIESDAATLTVTNDAVAPTIQLNPAPLSVTAGATAIFTTSASGTPAPSFRWEKDGITLIDGVDGITGATTDTLQIANTSAASGGAYKVFATNSAGEDESTPALLTINFPPVIVTGPSARTVSVGDLVTFTVSATGTPVLSYQWQKEGVDIPTATANSYSILRAALTDAGKYSVVVTNASGFATSAVANLTVNVLPVITAQPAPSQIVVTGQSVSFTVTATGTPAPSYRWKKDGFILSDGGGITGSTTPVLRIAPAKDTDAGFYTVTVTNSAGQVVSASAHLIVYVPPVITTGPAQQTVATGGRATFTVVATGTPAPTFQWRKDRVNIPTATSSTYAIDEASLDDAAVYSVVVTNAVGSVTSADAKLTVTAKPVITAQPTPRSLAAGQAVSFTVTATGTPAPSYRWKKDGVNLNNGSGITGATSATLEIASIKAANDGDYTVLVSNSAGSVESDAASLTVFLPPTITRGPSRQTVLLGETATFTVVGTGTPAPTYQWRKNGVDIPSATASTFVVKKATLADADRYSVVLSNTAGTVTSADAMLTVIAPPTITTQPSSQTVAGGSPVVLSVIATGTPDPTYQWFKDGKTIASATDADYSIGAAAISDTGVYTVRVRNAGGAVLSARATVRVTQAVDLTKPNVTQSYAPGSLLSFGAANSTSSALRYEWLLNGKVIRGATSTLYVVNQARASDSGVYTVKVYNSAGRLIATRVVARIVITVAGGYDAVLREPASREPVGRLTVDVADRGAYSGKLLFEDGGAYPFSGDFGLKNAEFSGTHRAVITRAPGMPKLVLDLAFNARDTTLAAVLTTSDDPSVLGQANASVRASSVVWDGSYRLVLKPVKPIASGQPNKPITASALIGKDGSLRLTGKTADGVSFDAKIPGGKDGTYAIFLQPYGKAGGHIAGTLKLVQKAGKYGANLSSSGVFTWFRPTNTGAYPSGIDLTLEPTLAQ